MDCIFCKIIDNKIPADKIYEDLNVLAFLDITPVNKGHTLIITKKHYETLLDINENDLKPIMKIAQKIAKAIMQGMKADGFNLSMNNYRAAGQLVPHAHFHIIPRFNGDGFKHWAGKKYEENESKEIAKKIKKLL